MFDVPTPPSRRRPRREEHQKQQQEQQQQQERRPNRHQEQQQQQERRPNRHPDLQDSSWSFGSENDTCRTSSPLALHHSNVSIPRSLSPEACPRPERVVPLPADDWISQSSSSSFRVILKHRYFDLQCAGIRAVLLYFMGAERVYLVEALLPSNLEEVGAFAQNEALPAIYILKPNEEEEEEENAEDEKKESKGKATVAAAAADDYEETAEKDRETDKMEASSLADAPFDDHDFSNHEAYYVRGAISILQTLYPLFDKHGRTLDDAMNWLTRGNDDEDRLTRILTAVHSSIFTTMVAQPGMVETYARHYVGANIWSAAIKYAAADIIVNLAAKKSALYPNSLREEMTWFMQCLQRSNPAFLKSSSRVVPRPASPQEGLDEEDEEEEGDAKEEIMEQDSDECEEDDEEDGAGEDENKSTSATTAATTLSSSSTRSSRSSNGVGGRSTLRRQRRPVCAPTSSDLYLVPVFSSGNYEPGPLDIRLYGALVAAMAVVQDRVRSSSAATTTRLKFRSWIHQDLRKAGALPWFQAVDRMYKLKCSQAPVISDSAHVCRSFYGAH